LTQRQVGDTGGEEQSNGDPGDRFQTDTATVHGANRDTRFEFLHRRSHDDEKKHHGADPHRKADEMQK